jgi:hypothetical protein
MEVTEERNSLFRVLDSVESATIVGTWRRPGQTASRAQGITEKTTFVHRRRYEHNIFMHAGAPSAHEKLLRK